MYVPVNLLILAQTALDIYDSEAVGGDIFERCLNFNNRQPEVTSDVISSPAIKDVGLDVSAEFGESRLNTQDALFSAVFRTPITSDRKHIVTSCPAWP